MIGEKQRELGAFLKLDIVEFHFFFFQDFHIISTHDLINARTH